MPDFWRFCRADTSGLVPNDWILARLFDGGHRKMSDFYLPGMFFSTRFRNRCPLGSRTTMNSSRTIRSRLHTAAPEVAAAVAAGHCDDGMVV